MERLGWSRQRWFWTVLALFSFQVALVFLLSIYEIEDRYALVPPLSIRLAPEIGDETTSRSLQLSGDPTYFALVHPESFSGSAWLKAPEFPYTPIDRIEPPTWLDPNPRGFSDEFSDYIESAFPRFVSTSNKLTAEVFQVPPSRPMIQDRAELSKQGDLADRRLVSNDLLPAPVPQQVLNTCVVAVVVDARGESLSAVLLDSSGSNSADQEALRFARSARFEPVSREASNLPAGTPPFAYGKLVFQWLAARKAADEVRLDR